MYALTAYSFSEVGIKVALSKVKEVTMNSDEILKRKILASIKSNPDKIIIGILGGMSDKSTAEYYRRINEHFRGVLGGHNTAEILIRSVNFELIEDYIENKKWDQAVDYLATAIDQLKQGGASFYIMACNSVHTIAEELETICDLYQYHIVDAVAAVLQKKNICKVGVLGTIATISEGPYRERFSKFGIETLVPKFSSDQQRLNSILFDELCHNQILPRSRQFCLGLIDELRERGAEAIVLSCTELNMLVSQKHYMSLPIIDSTEVHAGSTANLAILLSMEHDIDLSKDHCVAM